jgi:hypothetical protein
LAKKAVVDGTVVDTSVLPELLIVPSTFAWMKARGKMMLLAAPNGKTLLVGC